MLSKDDRNMREIMSDPDLKIVVNKEYPKLTSLNICVDVPIDIDLN